MDLREIDAVLRSNRQRTRRGKAAQKAAMGEDQLVELADVAYDGSPDNHRRATQLVRLLGCFSTQGKPLAPDLPCDQVV
ncbi:g1561 [Coccomyxa elongata]